MRIKLYLTLIINRISWYTMNCCFFFAILRSIEIRNREKSSSTKTFIEFNSIVNYQPLIIDEIISFGLISRHANQFNHLLLHESINRKLLLISKINILIKNKDWYVNWNDDKEPDKTAPESENDLLIYLVFRNLFDYFNSHQLII